MIDDEFTKTFLEKKGFLSKRKSFDCLTMDCPSDKLVELVLSLRDEENFDLLVDLTAIDHGEEAQVAVFRCAPLLFFGSAWVFALSRHVPRQREPFRPFDCRSLPCRQLA